ncbi:MAG: class I SAM-dependent methyltransferase [Pseudomonadota bacterium]|nr:class I SAM-dependent methyltransferase [Pseudomonadota bacterium]
MKQTPEELLARAYALSGDDETKSLYSDWASTYDATMLDGLGYLTPARTAAMLAESLADRDAEVLDVGSGTGLAGEELAKHGFATVDALDFSPEMLAVAGARGCYRRLVEADLNRPLEFAGDSYDAMICTGTFTHAHVGAACLDELFRVLKPGGLFACTVHRDVWRPAGFERKEKELGKAGTLETISLAVGNYYATSTEPEGFYVLWRRVG